MVRDVWLPPGNPGCLEATEFRPAFATILALARLGALVVRRAAALSKRHAKNRARARVVEAERWPPVWPLQGARASARARRHARMYSRACVRRDGHLAVGVGSQVKTASTPCLWTRRTHRDHPCARARTCWPLSCDDVRRAATTTPSLIFGCSIECTALGQARRYDTRRGSRKRNSRARARSPFPTPLLCADDDRETGRDSGCRRAIAARSTRTEAPSPVSGTSPWVLGRHMWSQGGAARSLSSLGTWPARGCLEAPDVEPRGNQEVGAIFATYRTRPCVIRHVILATWVSSTMPRYAIAAPGPPRSPWRPSFWPVWLPGGTRQPGPAPVAPLARRVVRCETSLLFSRC